MEKYVPLLNEFDTQSAIALVKDKFANELCDSLDLSRVSAPLFVKQGSGINDDLNGVERPVSFDILETGEIAEVVHSLAKWKRMALLKYGFKLHTGLYTDMNAIRRDEQCDSIHSLYVDQWDWEKIITAEDRTEDYLKATVRCIYGAVLRTAKEVSKKFPVLECELPQQISFVTTQELEDRYPNLNSKEREYEITRECGAVFIMKIGGRLKSGNKHDGRAPDYDDWELNGDIMVYHKTLDIALEISSMGIRVDRNSLMKQLKIEGKEERVNYEFHKLLLSGALPLTIGGGIGQSRLCMLLLHKAHIGEVQVSIWPEKEISKCKAKGINLL
ncbi:MAG: aspartate--ammonia ligase [Clostridia bacterium]|nr:aspartate--ammonia ligase [Clostridia bacterium]